MGAPQSVFDADGHVYELDHEIVDYLEPPYRGRRELLRNPFFPTGDGWHRMALSLARGGGLVEGEITAQKWMAALDEAGLEGSVLYATSGLAIGLIRDPDWAVALARGYNNWLSECILKKCPRLKGMAVLPLQSPGEAASELRRAVTQLGMVGGILPGGGLRTLLGDLAYLPVYQAAEELDTVLTVHTAFPQKGFAFDLDLLDRLTDVRCLLHPVGQMTQMTNMMFSGIFDRFPRLRVAFLEAGSAWVLCMMERMQREFEHWGHLLKDMKQEPKEHLRSGRIFFEAELGDAMLPYIVKELGDQALVFASDYPHFTSPGGIARHVREFLERGDLSDETKRRILGDNAKRLYKILPAANS
jgi:uncharacterized protein